MQLSIIIVHYKTPLPLQNCLVSIAAQTLKAYEVIVVDNENNPDLPSLISAFGPEVRLIQNTENVGFGRANNQGAKIATGNMLLLLNPDTELQDPNTLARLLQFQQDHPGLGVIGPKILDQGHAHLEPRLFYPGLKHDKSGLFNHLPGKIAWILGAAMLIPKQIFDQIKGFDPDYFLYGEEADLCLRIRQAGFALGYDDSIAILHIGGASEKATREYDYWLKKQRGLYLFYTKHYPAVLWRALLNQELRRARFRLFTLWLEGQVVKKPDIQNKVERNSAIRDAILKTLDNPDWLV